MLHPAPSTPVLAPAKAKAVEDPDLGTLPVWDLKDLYKGMKDKKLDRDLAKLEKEAAKFKKRYEGKLKRARGERIAKAVRDYEVLSDGLGRIMSFAGLLHAGNMTDNELNAALPTLNEARSQAARDVCAATPTTLPELQAQLAVSVSFMGAVITDAYAPELAQVLVNMQNGLDAMA